jgi:hypothetical protein
MYGYLASKKAIAPQSDVNFVTSVYGPSGPKIEYIPQEGERRNGEEIIRCVGATVIK